MTCKKHGIAAGIHTGSLDVTKNYLEQGFNLVTLGTDSAFLAQTAGGQLAQAKEVAAVERESSGY